MEVNNRSFSNFYIVGINYKKTGAEIRGRFSINNDQYFHLLKNNSSAGVNEFFILSTCNRMEIYGFAKNREALSQLVCQVTTGSIQEFESISYHKQGKEAIAHLFNVAAGLDSQILGDYEIVGQLKQAARISKEQNCLGIFLERLINEVLQASRRIRSSTALSGGTISVSFAAVQFIKQFYPLCTNKNILLIGTGKIGSTTLKNIIGHLPCNQVTLVNRSNEKAILLARKYNLEYGEMQNLSEHLHSADIIIVATNASNPIINATDLLPGKKYLLIDLSVPYNINVDVKHNKKVTLLNVDSLSKIKDETLKKRKAEIPKAIHIIQEHLMSFDEWLYLRRHVPVLKKVKIHLESLSADAEKFETKSASMPSLSIIPAEQKIQKAINGMALKMRTQNIPGCHCIEAMNDFINASVN